MTYTTQLDIMVPMRDGVRLATNVWMPDGPPAPVLLVRTPYGKDLFPDPPMVPVRTALLEAGYGVVWQDVRGRFRSEGEGFEPFLSEAQDGEDTARWIAEQPWCNGKIGAYGASYLGCVQWQTASRSPAGFTAIAPHFAATDSYYAPWFSEGGAMSWHLVQTWSGFHPFTKDLTSMESYIAAMEAAEKMVDLLPMADRPLIEQNAAWWSHWMEHTSHDDYWKRMSVSEHPELVTTPALNVGGWFDLYVNNTANTFRLMRERAGSEDARSGQRLVIGPWDHVSQSGSYPDLDLGADASDASSGIEQFHRRFFDHYLRGDGNALDEDARVKIFVMGANVWRDEVDWPLPDTRYASYYLDGAGHAATASGDGLLTENLPRVNAYDEYEYDPADPVRSIGGRILKWGECGPLDQSEVEQRSDVLCFSTPPLGHPVEVTGHISLVLNVTSSVVDTDFTGKLVDVHPDGRAIYLTDGILRTRYRDALDAPTLLTPGEVYELEIDLSVTSNVFLPGHRIRLEVSSSNYPRFDRNSNTGGHITDETEFAVATNRVLHGPAHPSRLILPLINR